MVYNFKKIEKKWQKKWEDKKIFETKEEKGKKKYYVLEMYPYPSGEGLHVGHAFNQVIGDVFARFRRLQGFNVLHPMGYDSFGLPAENAAIKAKSHPKKFTEGAIKNFVRQQKSLGLSYDWTRILWSHDPEYYKWNQWIFLKMFEKGLAYRKKAPANYCPSCKTVLANEQAQGGICERCKTEVQIKYLEQWFLKITDYADELYEKTGGLNWPERIRLMQKNWIGKSQGIEIDFEINRKRYPVFTTRADTIYGVTFLVISAQHPNLMDFVTNEEKPSIEKFLKKLKSVSEKEMKFNEKEGVFTGTYAKHPLTGEKIPVWAGNFVVADYGSGIVMGVPAHDQRDFEFAEKYGLGIIPVIQPDSKNKEIFKTHGKAILGNGKMINSEQFDGFNSEEAKEKIIDFLVKKKIGRRKTEFKLRDWLISRQRFWGTPIPIVYCDKCGIQSVPFKELPVKLPDNIKFTSQKNPLVGLKNFEETKCPKCKGKSKRETDTMDTFFDSSWYYLRFCDNKNKKEIFDKDKTGYWVPVDFYTGGAEHACLHLIYARFFTKFFRDMKLLRIDEPFNKLFNQGMVHAEDGRKMSKSLGNVINPSDMVKKYGADTLRIFLVSVASPDSDFSWNLNGMKGMFKFVNKVHDYFVKLKPQRSNKIIESKLNKTIIELTKDVEDLKYNLAIIKLRKLFDIMQSENVSRKDAENFLKLFSIFCPHIAEEIWEKFGNKKFISLEKWPVADKRKIDENLEKEEQAINKLIEDIVNVAKIISERNKKKVDKVFIYILPNEKSRFETNVKEIEKRTGFEIKIFAVNDKNKHDPEGKSKKVKPGRPGIYLE